MHPHQQHLMTLCMCASLAPPAADQATSSRTQSITVGNKAQLCVVYVAILADIFVTAYTDTLRTTDELAIILLLRYVVGASAADCANCKA